MFLQLASTRLLGHSMLLVLVHWNSQKIKEECGTMTSRIRQAQPGMRMTQTVWYLRTNMLTNPNQSLGLMSLERSSVRVSCSKSQAQELTRLTIRWLSPNYPKASNRRRHHSYPNPLDSSHCNDSLFSLRTNYLKPNEFTNTNPQGKLPAPNLSTTVQLDLKSNISKWSRPWAPTTASKTISGAGKQKPLANYSAESSSEDYEQSDHLLSSMHDHSLKYEPITVMTLSILKSSSFLLHRCFRR